MHRIVASASGRVARGLSVALLGVAAFGCATPAGKYLARRGADLADCVEAEAGVGWPIAPFFYPRFGGQAMDGSDAARKAFRRALLLPKLYVRVKATDFAVIGDGFTQPIRTGWRGRYRRPGRDLPLAAGLPIYRNNEETAGTATLTRWLVATTRTYSGPEPGPRGKVADRFWIGASLTLLLSARLDVNPAELADFVVGWVGWDLLRDDEWSPGKGGAPK